MSDDRRDIPLFLCCAEDNEFNLVKVVETLQKEGYNPEVVSGVEGESSLLGQAVDNAASRALFVICRSEALDRAHVRRLEGLFSARRGPNQTALTVSMVEDRPLDMLPAIREAMRTLAEAPDGDRDADEPVNKALLRDVVGSEPEDEREELARRLHDEMVAAEALLTRRSESKAAAMLSARVARQEDVTEVEAGAAAREFDVTVPEDGVPTVVSDQPTAPLDDDEDADDEPTRELDTAGLSDLAAKSVAKADSEVSSDDAVTQPEAEDSDEAEGVAAGARVAEDETNEEDIGSTTGRHSPGLDGDGDAAQEQPASRGIVWAGLAGLTAAVVMAISFMGAEPEDDRDAALEAIVDRAAEKAKARNENVSPDNGAAMPSGVPEAPVAPTEPPPTPQGSDEPTGVAPAVVPPSPSGAPAADAPSATPEATPPKPEATPPVATPASKPAPPSDEAKAKAVAAAIESGEILELGPRIVSLGRGESQTWKQARSACRRRKVDVVDQWRLPSRSDLKRMRDAGILAKNAYYWARDRAEHDDEAYAMDVSNGAINVYLRAESIARAACIQRKR